MSDAGNPFQGIFISDSETETDLLYYEAIARTVASYVEKSGNTPISIGVHGDWGAGKSSVLKMTERQLAGKDGVLCLAFNGWQFEGLEDAKTALIEHIVVELRDQRSGFAKVKETAADVLKEVDYLKVAKVAFKYGGTLLTGIPHPGIIADALGALKYVGDLIQDGADKTSIGDALEAGMGILKMEKDKERKKVPEEIKEFRKAFSSLLDAAKITRLVVLIDDLDRCLPETAIATLEAIRLFLFTERTAFVIGADEQMIEYSVRRHFPDFQKSGLPESYARNYLEKLIQVPFRISALGRVETQCYVALVLAEAALTTDEGRQLFEKLADKAKSGMARPWAGQPLSSADVDSLQPGAMGTLLQEGISISTQISPILTGGTKGNPRQIKRFLNAVLIRLAIAHERGLSGEIKVRHLAKVMLAERFNSTFFDQLSGFVGQSEDGKPKILRLLESGKSEKTDLPDEQEKTLKEWTENSTISEWAAIQPALADEDLRPYIFITRDRQQSIFGNVMDPRLAALVTRLSGSEVAVNAARQEVRALTLKDTMDVTRSLKAMVLASGEFEKKPDGVDGLVLAVEEKPETAAVLFDLLKEIPPSKLGSWALPPLKSLMEDPALKAVAIALKEKWLREGHTKLKLAINVFGEP